MQNDSNKKHCKPIITTINGYHVHIFFMHYNGKFVWIFNQCNGQQSIINEETICAFLGISERTARAWRRQQTKPDSNALLLLHLIHAGHVMPPEWVKKGFGYVRENLHHRERKITQFEVEEIDYLRWCLKQATEALRSSRRELSTLDPEVEANDYRKGRHHVHIPE